MHAATGGISRRQLLIGGSALAALTLAGCGVRPGTKPAAEPSGQRFVAYGDSLTAGHRRKLSYGPAPEDSWLGHTGDKLYWVGGAAVSGATAHLLPRMLTDTPVADYVLYFFGTNDRRHGRSVADMVGDIEAAHESIPEEKRSRQVCLVAIGPVGDVTLSSALEKWNTQVKHAAEDRGWFYLDPWLRLRASVALGGAGQWQSRPIHRDQLHPTVEGAELLGHGMADTLAALKRVGG